MTPYAATPQQARAKQVTRTAMEYCGGIDAVSAIDIMPGKSQVGRWHSLNERDLPRIDYAAAMDAVAVAEGREPPFATWLAHEAERVLIDPPAAEPTRAGWLARMGELATVTGELHSEFCTALADGRICDRDRADLRAEVRRVQTELAAIDAALAQGDE